jgi:hypothetical protein
MRTVKTINGISAAERFYKKLGGAIRYIMPAAAALAFMGMSTNVHAQTPSTNITLTNLSVSENEVVGTAVGFLAADDADIETHTFALVPGVGDDDNASFSILANKLQTNEVFNFEVKASYSVRISATGDDGLVYEKPFIVTIDDANDKPELSTVTRSVEINATLDLTLSDFELAYADQDGHGLNTVEITSLPDYGVLRLNAAPVAINDIISAGDLDFLHFDAPDSILGRLSFDWKADDGIDFADADGTFYIKVNQGRIVGGSASVDASGITLPSGTLIVGHPGTRPSSGTLAGNTTSGSGATGGRRASGVSVDPTFSKLGDEATGFEQYEKYDLSVKAYPNPFVSTAVINFTLSEESMVEVNVYNYMGALVKQVVKGMQPTGVNTVKVGDDLSNGSYIYTVKVLAADGQTTMLHNGSLVKVK